MSYSYFSYSLIYEVSEDITQYQELDLEKKKLSIRELLRTLCGKLHNPSFDAKDVIDPILNLFTNKNGKNCLVVKFGIRYWLRSRTFDEQYHDYEIEVLKLIIEFLDYFFTGQNKLSSMLDYMIIELLKENFVSESKEKIKSKIAKFINPNKLDKLLSHFNDISLKGDLIIQGVCHDHSYVENYFGSRVVTGEKSEDLYEWYQIKERSSLKESWAKLEDIYSSYPKELVTLPKKKTINIPEQLNPINGIQIDLDFTEKFYQAMRTWEKPQYVSSEEEDLRIECEMKLKDKLIHLKRVKAISVVSMFDVQYQMGLKVGNYIESRDSLKHECLMVFEDTNQTQIYWLDEPRSLKPEFIPGKQRILRTIKGRPWGIKELFFKYSNFDEK